MVISLCVARADYLNTVGGRLEKFWKSCREPMSLLIMLLCRNNYFTFFQTNNSELNLEGTAQKHS